MTRKTILVTLVTLMAILAMAAMPFMAGCSKPSAETPAAPSTPAPTEPAAPATPEPAPAEKITLRYIAGTPGNVPTSVPGRGAIAWKADVEEMSGGRLEIQLLNGAAPDPELYDIVEKGGGDICQNPIMFNSGRFPTLEALVVPDMGTTDRHPSRTAWELWKAVPSVDEEFNQVKLLSTWCATQAPPGISFCTANKPVRTVDDLKGMKFGTYGKWGTDLFTALGCSVVAVPPPDVYESLQRKIVDASALDPEILEANKVYEVAKYWHQLNFQFVPFFMVVNLNTWNSLPADLQKVMEDAAAKLPDQIDADWRESTVRALNDAVDLYGIEIIEYSPEELARFNEAAQPIQDEYAAMLDERGLDGKAILDLIQELHDKNAEW